LEFETNLWDSVDDTWEEETDDDCRTTDDIRVEQHVTTTTDGATVLDASPAKTTLVANKDDDPRSCSHLLVFFRALLALCPTLKRVHVTLLSETDAVRFVVYIGELTRLVASAKCLHIENLFFLGHHAVITDRKSTT
jgi:hypothetical protein